MRYAQWLGLVFLLVAAWTGAARASDAYTLDQTDGSIEFTVTRLGLFPSHGVFHRFLVNLSLDSADPYQSRIVVTMDAGSARMDGPRATEILLSPDFFDTARFPSIRFASTRITRREAGRYVVEGSVEIRGITRPFSLDTRLVAERPDSRSQAEIADFVATGTLQRASFGMTADPLIISDAIGINIHARLLLSARFHGG